MFKLITQATCALTLGFILSGLLTRFEITAHFSNVPMYVAFGYLVVLAVRASRRFSYMRLLTISAAISIILTALFHTASHILTRKVLILSTNEMLSSGVTFSIYCFIGFSALFAFIKLAESWLDKP